MNIYDSTLRITGTKIKPNCLKVPVFIYLTLVASTFEKKRFFVQCQLRMLLFSRYKQYCVYSAVSFKSLL